MSDYQDKINRVISSGLAIRIDEAVKREKYDVYCLEISRLAWNDLLFQNPDKRYVLGSPAPAVLTKSYPAYDMYELWQIFKRFDIPQWLGSPDEMGEQLLYEINNGLLG